MKTDTDESTPLKPLPLGVFGWNSGRFEAATRTHLVAGQKALDVDRRESLASYLETGSTIFAIMGYELDLINRSFGCSGASSLLSDGVYFWRRDAALYVRHYGIALLAHDHRRGYVPRKLSESEVLEIYDYLTELFSRKESSDESES
jgi:hypothetical protein